MADDKVILEPENTLIGEFQKERTDAISEMFDNPDELGIYPTTKFFIRLDNCVRKIIDRLQPERLNRPELREKIQKLWCQHCKAMQKTNDTVVECWYNPLAIDGGCAFCASNEDAVTTLLPLIPDNKAEIKQIFGELDKLHLMQYVDNKEYLDLRAKFLG